MYCGTMLRRFGKGLGAVGVECWYHSIEEGGAINAIHPVQCKPGSRLLLPIWVVAYVTAVSLLLRDG